MNFFNKNFEFRDVADWFVGLQNQNTNSLQDILQVKKLCFTCKKLYFTCKKQYFTCKKLYFRGKKLYFTDKTILFSLKIYFTGKKNDIYTLNDIIQVKIIFQK